MAGVVLHVRNIPCKILEADLRDVMQEVGLDVSRYELHLPKKPGRQGRYNNFGYGFVTCHGPEDAELFTRALQGFHFENIASSKRLVIEPGRGNAAVELMDSAYGHPGAPDAMHEWTQRDCDWWSTDSSFTMARSSTTASYFQESAGWAEHNARFPTVHRGPQEYQTVSGYAGPDASEVPSTRLAPDGRSLVHFEADSTDALFNVSSRTPFCFQ
eukprot:TRINITY_DN2819_c0_g1_i2.p1 TRINITY_DN2819_c0_g1~~TRINITY_DN2819_c0_g1_i2.p1  ORF type:complete len:214 (+),score=12.13 TRINITY_DN2819_c0_g1_i2:99-740(+)